MKDDYLLGVSIPKQTEFYKLKRAIPKALASVKEFDAVISKHEYARKAEEILTGQLLKEFCEIAGYANLDGFLLPLFNGDLDAVRRAKSWMRKPRQPRQSKESIPNELESSLTP